MPSLTSGGMRKTGVVIDIPLLTDVDAIAAELHISRSAALRTLMRKGIDAHRREQSIIAFARDAYRSELPVAS